jgi:hypothetical protein
MYDLTSKRITNTFFKDSFYKKNHQENQENNSISSKNSNFDLLKNEFSSTITDGKGYLLYSKFYLNNHLYS